MWLLEKAKSKKLLYNEKEPKVTAGPVICLDNLACDPLYLLYYSLLI